MWPTFSARSIKSMFKRKRKCLFPMQSSPEIRSLLYSFTALSGIWEAKERAIPVAMFSLVAVLGTVGAPLYSGFIVESLGWRWVEWIHMIMSGEFSRLVHSHKICN